MTTKERLFVRYYLGKAKGNGSLAARMAGYKHAALLAHQLLRKLHIREAIDSKLDTIGMDADEVLARLAARARSGMDDFVAFDAKGSPFALPRLDFRKAKRRDQLGNVKKLKANRSAGDDPIEIVEVEVHDALPALALLAKYHGLDKPAIAAANPAIAAGDAAIAAAMIRAGLEAAGGTPDDDPRP